MSFFILFNFSSAFFTREFFSVRFDEETEACIIGFGGAGAGAREGIGATTDAGAAIGAGAGATTGAGAAIGAGAGATTVADTTCASGELNHYAG